MDTAEKKSFVERALRAFCSIRTRFSLMTAFFLFFAIGLFYIGGRIVLVHFISDTERQVRDVGRDVSRLAYRQAEGVRTAAIRALARPRASEASAQDLLSGYGEDFSLVAVYSTTGMLTEGVLRDLATGGPTDLREKDLAGYSAVITDWIAVTRDASANVFASASTGIIRLGDRLHAVVLLPRVRDCVIFGMPFSVNGFLGRGNGTFGGMEIHIGTEHPRRARRAFGRKSSAVRPGHGIAPMFSEAMEFYSGGFWKLRNDPMEAVFAIRDIAGNAVSSISVSLPRTFAGATRLAILRLAFFIAVCGIVLVLPLFWAQSRILLNPLTTMTRAILDMRTDGTDCPRIEWKGKDEFAQLAESVNRMVETIAAKTVSLANSEASHQALLDGVPDGLVVFDLQGRMVSITKQPEGVGPLPGFFPGEPPAAAVYGVEPVAAFEAAVQETARTGFTSKVRLKKQRPLGVPRSVPTRHFELRLTRLGTRFVLAIVRDMTAEVAEHKLRLEAERRSLDASKRESLTGLAAGIAHDMNNVLSIVLNAAESEGADPSGDSAKTLLTIRDAVRRGSSMMRELMTFAGENRMRFMRASPRLVMEDVRHLAARMAGPNIELVIDSADNAPDVDVDPNQFWKVLFNIVKNAAEAIGSRPGRIALSAQPFRMSSAESAAFASEHPLVEGEGVLFRVEDDGPGISPDIIGRIFDPYVSSKALGRGLGLATVRTIVEAHGGGIRVESAVDRGTIFTVFLPVSKLAPVEPATAEQTPAPEQKGDVLVVDDDEAILKTCSRLLKVQGVTAHVARGRREALAVVRRHAGDLRAIILDANLGGIDTVRLLGAFRIGAPNVKVIVSSGSAEEEIRKMFIAHPFDGFLAKPYTIVELMKKVVA